jgi:hypothetical protein
MDIHPAARKHDVADEDIRHGTANAIAVDDQDDDTRLYLGPARDGEMLRSSPSLATTVPSLRSTR